MNTNSMIGEITNDISSNIENINVILSHLNIQVKGKSILCMYHPDSNPSMSMHEHNGIILFKCFSCQASVNIVSIVQKTLGLSNYFEALTECCKILGIEAPTAKEYNFASFDVDTSAILMKILDFQNQNYKEFSKSDVYQNLLHVRHIPESIIKYMRIIFLDYNQLLNLDLAKADIQKFIKTIYGSMSKEHPEDSEKGQIQIEYTSKWIFNPATALIPCFNEHGILTGGIIYSPTITELHQSKYITLAGTNPADKAIKNSFYFNQFNGFKEAEHTGVIYITEGVMDCLSLIKNKRLNSVALLGVNKEHATLVEFIHSSKIHTVYLALDTDHYGTLKTNAILEQLDSTLDIYIFNPNPTNTPDMVKDIDQYINLPKISFTKNEDHENYFRSAFVHIQMLTIQHELLQRNALYDHEQLEILTDEFITTLATSNRNEKSAYKMMRNFYDFVKNGVVTPRSYEDMCSLYDKRISTLVSKESLEYSSKVYEIGKRIRNSHTFHQIEKSIDELTNHLEEWKRLIVKTANIDNLSNLMNIITNDFYHNKKNTNNNFFILGREIHKFLYYTIPKGRGWAVITSGRANTGKSISAYNLIADILKNNAEDTTVIWLCLDDSRTTGDDKLAPIMYNIHNDHNMRPTKWYRNTLHPHFKTCADLMIKLQKNKNLYVLDSESISKDFGTELSVRAVLDGIITKQFINNSNYVKENVVLLIDSVSSFHEFSTSNQGSDSGEWEYIKNWSNLNKACVINVNEMTKTFGGNGSAINMIPAISQMRGSAKSTYKTDLIVLINNLTEDANTVNALDINGIKASIPQKITIEGVDHIYTQSSLVINIAKNKDVASIAHATGLKYAVIDNLYGTIEAMPKQQVIDLETFRKGRTN